MLPAALQGALRALSLLNADVLVHPESMEELANDPDGDRRDVALSKAQTYPLLDPLPAPGEDPGFLSVFGNPSDYNEYVDNSLLYAVHRDAVDFLLTEDRGIHKKARQLGIEDRVLSIEEAHGMFKRDATDEQVGSPPAIREEPVHNLSVDDPLFDSLREDYPEFDDWFRRISRQGRRCWVNYNEDDSLGAVLIFKTENEPIDSVPPLPARERLKISTLKATRLGFKIGELFIKLSVDYAVKNGLDELYLTHFTREEDYLVDLIAEYGFEKKAVNRRGEDVFVKELFPDEERVKSFPSPEISKRFYPSLYDGEDVKKFVVPIRPEYHNRLFTDYTERQSTISEHQGEFVVEGNTIKKAYLCHSRITKVSPGDILLFYRSRDTKTITSLGIVEELYPGLQDADDIAKRVGKRTVYSPEEIEKMAEKPTMVLLFVSNCHLENQLSFEELEGAGVLSGPPRSITEIPHEDYLTVRGMGGIDERFAVD